MDSVVEAATIEGMQRLLSHLTTRVRNARLRTVLLGTATLATSLLTWGCGTDSGPASIPIIEGKVCTLGFSSADVGRVPDGWSVDRTGGDSGSDWRVVADETSPSKSGFVLAQTAVSPRSTFNLCVFKDGSYADVKLQVRVKAIEGDVDQGGGLVWRYVDANNYYVCRFNPLEDNFRVYKVVAGERHQLASVDANLVADEWHTLTAAMKGNLIVCDAAGTSLSVRDDTFQDAGRIGLWTKADARSRFDAVQVTGTPATETSGEKD